jgi:hypothetical protein
MHQRIWCEAGGRRCEATLRPGPKSTSPSPSLSAMAITASSSASLYVRRLSAWPRTRKSARAFLREHSYTKIRLAQLLGQPGASSPT